MPTELFVTTRWDNRRKMWVSKLEAKALDITTGEIDCFGNEWASVDKPTRQEICKQVVGFLYHEVQEQLGLHPHDRVTELVMKEIS